MPENRWPTFEISIHAPAEGATGAVSDPVVIIVISIHAPAEGATLRTKYLSRSG